MPKRLHKLAALGLAAALAAALSLAPAARLAADQEADLFDKLKIFSLVVHEIQKKFVEQPKSDELVYGAIRGMLSTLDPHSSFLTPEEMKDFQQEAQGSFYGVGIEITVRDEALTVVSPIEGTPAFNAGMQAGDHIVKIGDKPTKNMGLTEAVKLIRGPKGSKVTFTVSREKEKALRTFTVTRDLIPLRSVRWETLEPGLGYARIISFQGDTHAEMRKALADLKGAKALILDLRNDPGGLLDQAVKVGGLFLGRQLIVSTKGRIAEQNFQYVADIEAEVPADVPMAVLVNEGSASASEIVAGALQDHKRATVVGAQSFGKGSVQTVFPLPDGSGLRLTTARFYTPSGRSIQADGIAPDVPVASYLPPDAEPLRERDLDRHLTGANEKPKGQAKAEAQADDGEGEGDEFEMPDRPITEMPLAERLKFDPQLARALEILRKKI